MFGGSTNPKTLKQAEKNGDADDTGDTLSLAIVQLTHHHHHRRHHQHRQIHHNHRQQNARQHMPHEVLKRLHWTTGEWNGVRPDGICGRGR